MRKARHGELLKALRVTVDTPVEQTEQVNNKSSNIYFSRASSVNISHMDI